MIYKTISDAAYQNLFFVFEVKSISFDNCGKDNKEFKLS